MVYYGSDSIKHCPLENKSYSADEEIPLRFVKPEGPRSQ
jgi:hypothetical protein